MTDTGAAPTKEQLIARYKTILRELIDKRPSGTRLKIAAAIGRHKSFVSQIVSPANPMPLPGTHIPTILSICHFSDDERGRFLKAYRAAHPTQFAKLGTGPEGGDAGRQREVEATIRDLAKRIIALALDK
jgi:hypothetical protein